MLERVGVAGSDSLCGRRGDVRRRAGGMRAGKQQHSQTAGAVLRCRAHDAATCEQVVMQSTRRGAEGSGDGQTL